MEPPPIMPDNLSHLFFDHSRELSSEKTTSYLNYLVTTSCELKECSSTTLKAINDSFKEWKEARLTPKNTTALKSYRVRTITLIDKLINTVNKIAMITIIATHLLTELTRELPHKEYASEVSLRSNILIIRLKNDIHDLPTKSFFRSGDYLQLKENGETAHRNNERVVKIVTEILKTNKNITLI